MHPNPNLPYDTLGGALKCRRALVRESYRLDFAHTDKRNMSIILHFVSAANDLRSSLSISSKHRFCSHKCLWAALSLRAMSTAGIN